MKVVATIASILCGLALVGLGILLLLEGLGTTDWAIPVIFVSTGVLIALWPFTQRGLTPPSLAAPGSISHPRIRWLLVGATTFLLGAVVLGVTAARWGGTNLAAMTLIISLALLGLGALICLLALVE